MKKAWHTVKSKVSPVVHVSSYASGVSTRLTKRARGMSILRYHNVGGGEVSEKKFRAALRYLRSNFSVIPLAELVRKLREHEPIAGNEVVLTFDDGYRKMLTVVQPILQEFKMPATLFVCPGLIENRQWLWTDDVRERLTFINPVQLDRFAAEQGWPDLNIQRLILRMKKQSNADRLAQYERIRARTKNFEPSAHLSEEFDLMTWPELSALDPELITIGSHSSTHPVLSNLSPEELQAEIVGSREMLEKKLGRTVEFFCYPDGDLNEAAIKLAAQTYIAAVTTERRQVRLKENVFRLPRISAAGSISLLAWRMFRPTA